MRRLLVLVVVLVLAPFALGACGGGDEGGDETAGDTGGAATTEAGGGGGGAGGGGDPEAGAEVFASAGCGGCHTLAAAGATGARAPNLDSLQPSESEVREQVTNGGGGMPAFGDRLTDQEIADVAAFVATNAGS